MHGLRRDEYPIPRRGECFDRYVIDRHKHVTPGVLEDVAMLATVLRVRSVKASVDWYRDVLDLEPIHVGADGPEHPFAVFSIAGSFVSLWPLAPEATASSDPDSGTYLSLVVRTELEPVQQMLAERGVEVDEVRRSANHEFFWFSDLDGNRFEISRPV
jgi:catechol 2,3-dioxygenase-like lactoylglutathione lyase family enzyme